MGKEFKRRREDREKSKSIKEARKKIPIGKTRNVVSYS